MRFGHVIQGILFMRKAALTILLILLTRFLLSAQESRSVSFPAGQDTLLAENHQKLADSCFAVGDFQNAREHAQKSFFLRQKIYGPGHIKVAESLDNVGWAELCFDRSQQADSCFRQALAIRLAQQLQDKLLLAKSYHNLAVLYGQKQDFGGALDNIQRALAFALETVGKNHPFTANLYLGLGNCYGMVADWDNALAYYIIAYDILVALFGERHQEVIAPLNNIAEMYAMKGEYEKSIEYHNRTRAVILALFGENVYYANSCNYLADAYKKMGDYDAAIDWYEKAAAVHEKLKMPRSYMYRILQNSIADLYFARKEYRRSLEFVLKSLESYSPKPRLDAGLSLRDGHWPINQEFLWTLEIKAKVHHQLAHRGLHAQIELQTSMTTFRIAAAILDSMRRDLQIGRERSQQKISVRANEIIDEAVGVALELAAISDRTYYEEMAFRLVQQDKAAALALSLQDVQARHYSGIDPVAAERESELSSRLAQSRTALDLQAEHGALPDDSSYLALQSNYFSCAAEYQKMIKNLEKSYPRYYQAKYEPGMVSMADLGKKLDKETALLEYYVADSSLYIFAITAEGFQVVRHDWSAVNQEAVDQYCAAIKGDRRERFIKSSQTLHGSLIMPVINAIAGKKKLVILPHDLLYRVAFEALLATREDSGTFRDEKGPDRSDLAYLIEKYVISYHYSSRIYLSALLDEDRRQLSGGQDLLAFAPFSEKGDAKLSTGGLFAQFLDAQTGYPSWITRDGAGLCQLPASAYEVENIVSAFHARKLKGTALVGRSASETSFINASPKARYIHLATHSFVNEEQPQLSGIAFNRDQNEGQDDGILYAGEIYTLDLCSDLVVLSSCESGIGKLVKGEGMIGLTRGFLYAGARNVIASLWKVQDRAAAELMIDFYHHALQGESYKEALQKAKIKFIHSREKANPALWSGYVLYGE
jgi:CHAT domain-containing protein